MLDNLKLIIKGFFIGIANIIPGVSGGTLMIALGIYEDIIEAISHFFSNVKKHLKLALLLCVGALVSVAAGSFFITSALENFKLPTILFFIGLILGGIPMLFKKVKGNVKSVPNILLFLVTFLLILAMTFFSGETTTVSLSSMNVFSYILLFLVGIIAAASMVVPGISGSFILIFLGYYEPILNTIKDLLGFNNIGSNILILAVFGVGVIVGIVLVAKLIEFLLQKFEIRTYSAILGFVISSVISIFITSLREGMNFDILHIVSGIVLLVIGFTIAFKLSDKE